MSAGTLTILNPGLCTLLVDRGRPRSRSLGVPVGGAFDRFSLAIGNALVGNEPFTPALEITLRGPQLIADRNLTCVVFGAPFQTYLTDARVESQRPFVLPANRELAIESTRENARAYFCAYGGLWGAQIMDSQSSLAPLEKGDRLKCSQGRRIARYLQEASFEWRAQPHVLRTLPGPQSSWFDRDALVQRPFVVSSSSNRMGLRLEGEPLQVPDGELLSEPVCPGSIQVLHNGQLVILGVDGQSIGGYPKIGQVASADVDKLAQLRPGDEIRFARITLSEARAAYRRKKAELMEWLARLRVSASL